MRMADDAGCPPSVARRAGADQVIALGADGGGGAGADRGLSGWWPTWRSTGRSAGRRARRPAASAPEGERARDPLAGHRRRPGAPASCWSWRTCQHRTLRRHTRSSYRERPVTSARPLVRRLREEGHEPLGVDLLVGHVVPTSAGEVGSIVDRAPSCAGAFMASRRSSTRPRSTSRTWRAARAPAVRPTPTSRGR